MHDHRGAGSNSNALLVARSGTLLDGFLFGLLGNRAGGLFAPLITATLGAIVVILRLRTTGRT
jgi:uncharacterized membrane protein YeaQ/YmgE (transglycosylase-associated protein family)